jgi:hypothetical protein
MAFVVGVFEGDFDAWKQRFDSDPIGRRQVAKEHMIFSSVDNPNLFFVRIEFDSAKEARSFAEKARGSDVLANLSPIVPPTVIELAEQTSY